MDKHTKKAYDRLAQAVRFARSEEILRAAGGKRINVRLQPPAVEALKSLKRRRGIDQTEAINLAIMLANGD